MIKKSAMRLSKQFERGIAIGGNCTNDKTKKARLTDEPTLNKKSIRTADSTYKKRRSWQTPADMRMSGATTLPPVGTRTGMQVP